MLVTVFLLLSIPVLGAWVFQVFCGEGENQFAGGSDYLGLPSKLWSTILFALFLGLLFEGISRLRRRVT